MKLDKSISLFEKMLNTSQELFGSCDRDGFILYLSNACNKMLGYSSQELVGRHYSEILHPEDLESTTLVIQDIFENDSQINFDNRFFHKDGHIVYAHWSGAWSEDDKLLYFIGHDVTAQKLEKQKLGEQQELHRALVEHGSDMLALFDESISFTYSSGSTQRILGYSPEQLVGVNAFSLIHPDDVPQVQEKLLSVLASESHATISDFRFKDANGEWKWLETTISNQLQNPAVRALVTSSRDITESFINKKKLIESEQRFRSMFNENPDAILIENPQGLVIDANPAAEALLSIPKHLILNRHFSEFLPPETVEVCTRHLQEAFSGNTVKFELEADYEEYGKLNLEITKIPVTIGTQTIAVHSVIKNITAKIEAQKELKKLSLVAQHTTNGVVITDADRKIVWTNEGFTRLTGYSFDEAKGRTPSDLLHQKNADITPFNLVKPDMLQGKPVSFEIQNQKKDGNIVWTSVQVNPVHNEKGELTNYVTLQTDISQLKKSEQELEKLSLVASGTDNGVVITDAHGLTEWVNEGFTRITGYTSSEIVGRKPGELLQGPETDPEAIRTIGEKLRSGSHFNILLINYKKSGEKFWVSMDITPVHDEAGHVRQFIAIQKDVTFIKEAEADLLKMTQDLYAQNRDLQQFTYIVSHNLRAPVANAIGLTSLLSKVDKDSELFNLTLSNLKQSVSQLDVVLKDMNTILSIRDGKGNLEKEQVRVKQKIKQALESLQEPLQKCGGEVIIDVDDNLSVLANKAYIYSIFYNLLSNSIKYRSQSRALKVRVKSFGNSSNGTLISFSDNGSGFDMKSAKDSVFKLYKRFHMDKKGRGIGLYLIKTHLEAMGGHIEVTSQAGAGTRFLIYLPKI